MRLKFDTVRNEWDLLAGAAIFLLCLAYILWELFTLLR
jgi:hypothetical protein